MRNGTAKRIRVSRKNGYLIVESGMITTRILTDKDRVLDVFPRLPNVDESITYEIKEIR